MEVRPFDPSDEEAVVRLWTDCGLVVPWNNPRRDIQRKLKVQPEMFLVGCMDGRVIATVMAGHDGHRGWINYLAVHPDHRRGGVGRRMMKEAENRLRAAGCPKINLQVRSGNIMVIELYERIGFRRDDVVSLGKRLEPDNRAEPAVAPIGSLSRSSQAETAENRCPGEQLSGRHRPSETARTGVARKSLVSAGHQHGIPATVIRLRASSRQGQLQRRLP